MKALVRNPEAVRGLVMEGAAPGASVIVSKKLPLALLVPVVAVSEIAELPVGVPIGTVPEIAPVVLFKDKYEGKFGAPYDVAIPPEVAI